MPPPPPKHKPKLPPTTPPLPAPSPKPVPATTSGGGKTAPSPPTSSTSKVSNTGKAASAAPASKPASSAPSTAAPTVWFEVYKATQAGLGWRWAMWQKWGNTSGNALLACHSGRNLETEQQALDALAEFKKFVATAPIIGGQ